LSEVSVLAGRKGKKGERKWEKGQREARAKNCNKFLEIYINAQHSFRAFLSI